MTWLLSLNQLLKYSLPMYLLYPSNEIIVMARVYDDGLKPIQVDAEKAQEYRTRAREMTESTNSDALEVYPGCDHMTGINDYSIDHVFSLTP